MRSVVNTFVQNGYQPFSASTRNSEKLDPNNAKDWPQQDVAWVHKSSKVQLF